MSLHVRNMNQITEENGAAVFKKGPTKPRGVLGEIGNQISNRGKGVPIARKNSLKDVKAKVDTRRPSVDIHPARRVVPNVPAKTVVGVRTVNRPTTRMLTEGTKAKKEVPVPKVPSPPMEEIPVPVIEEEIPSALSFIDMDVEEDPVLVAIYAEDIYKHLRSLERQFPVKPDFLADQQITKRMRSMLVEWLQEVSQQFHLLPETTYLNVAILDRFIQAHRTVTRKTLQLVGISCMSLAAKYEETYPPDMGDYVYVSDNSCTRAQIQHMESVVLKMLDFNLCFPLPIHFLRRFSKASGSNAIQHTMGKYFLELTLLEYSMSHLAPSLVAAASTFLTLWLLDDKKTSVWTRELEFYSRYSLKEISPVVRQLAKVVIDAETSNFKVTRGKYLSPKMLQVSVHPVLACPEIKELAAGKGDL